MRLLHTSHLKFREYIGQNIPRYAILSHTWVEDEEISFKEWQDQTPETSNKSGYRKIIAACREARGNGLNWIWVDTCCIDKSSSAELTEAINSMYKWYERSSVCYAYMSDVISSESFENEFDGSRWFTRGWTLQELLAPAELAFFNKYWQKFGEKRALSDRISRITGIAMEHLTGAVSVRYASVASRMSWASKRKTTRIEDIAYCLFGLFDVNLPLLYGEGQKAFRRLQEEILRTSVDQSLFAWRFEPNTERPDTFFLGLLAPSPKYFQSWAYTSSVQSQELPKPYSSTNLGLTISLPLTPAPGTSEPNLFLAILDVVGPRTSERFGILLKRLLQNMYARVDPTALPIVKKDDHRFKDTEVCIPHNMGERILWRGVSDISRIGGLFVKQPPRLPSSQQHPAVLIESQGAVRVLENGVLYVPLTANGHRPNTAIGTITVQEFSESQLIQSSRILFGYDNTDNGKELWIAEVPTRDLQGMQSTDMQKHYPGMFWRHTALSPFSRFKFYGGLGLDFDRLYYYLNMD